MRTSRRLSMLAALALLSGTTWAGQAQAPPSSGELDDLSGTYRLTSGHDSLRRGIERAVMGLNFFIRGFARTEIRRAVQPEPSVRIDAEGSDRVAVQLGDWRSPAVSVRGAPVQVTGSDGIVSRFSVQRSGPGLYLRSETDRGTRESWLRPDREDGALWMQVRISSHQLPIPIQYDLRYRRAR